MLTNLRCLKMYNSSNWKGITDVGMRELAKLSKLEVLQLNFFKRITNDGITEINHLKSLQELRILLPSPSPSTVHHSTLIHKRHKRSSLSE